MSTAERRKSERISAKFKVDCIKDNVCLVSFSKDISVDGMFLYTKDPPEVGQRVVLHFAVDAVKKLKAPAQVVWVNKSGSQKDFGMGVKFIDLKTDAKRDILHAVQQVTVMENSDA